MSLVAGVDSSTQSTKVEVRDAASGEIVATGSAPHPAVTAPVCEQDPESWWTAFQTAWAAAGSPAVEAISVGGQQHAMVVVDRTGVAVHPAKLWNDTESSPDSDALIDQLGGTAQWAAEVGSVPVAAFTITKLAWLRRTRPDAWDNVAAVMLPHDYLTARLTGALVPGLPLDDSQRPPITTDRGDASGTGYWSPASGEYRWDLLALIDRYRDWERFVPHVLGPLDSAGYWAGPGAAGPALPVGSNGVLVGPGTGDNMSGALGVGLRPGDAVISIGTSGTVYAVSSAPTADTSGAVAGFADATGRFLPLVCTSNASKVLDAARRLLAVDHSEFDRLALAARPGGPVMLPYLDGERTPNRPDATGVISGIRSDITREQLARAAVDGVACGLLDGFDALCALTDLSTPGGRIVLTGGGARSESLQRVIAGLVDRPVVVSDVAEAVATGAAVQAASVLEQVDSAVIQQRWGLGSGTPTESAVPDELLRQRYAALRDQLATNE